MVDPVMLWAKFPNSGWVKADPVRPLTASYITRAAGIYTAGPNDNNQPKTDFEKMETLLNG
jgi:hypothetical protein